MHNSDPAAPSPLNNSNLIKMKERPAFNQVMTCKAFNMQRILQVAHRVAQKSCRRAGQLFCIPLGLQLCEKVTCCPGPNHQSTGEDTEDTTTQVALQSPPSTILIVNISNSTLIDCVIGNDTYPSLVAESQPLMHKSKLQMHDLVGCSCSRGQQVAVQSSPVPQPPSRLPSPELPNISIHNSHLNCVIIGDNNYMHAEQGYSTEPEEQSEALATAS